MRGNGVKLQVSGFAEAVKDFILKRGLGLDAKLDKWRSLPISRTLALS
jgi:hypothetical protein